jgi:hypothetical protein
LLYQFSARDEPGQKRLQTLTEGLGFSNANLTKGTLPNDLDGAEVGQLDFGPPKAELL